MSKQKRTKLKTFLITYHAGAAAQKKVENATPEEMKIAMAQWMAWFKKCGKRLVDMGDPLSPGVNIRATGPVMSSRRRLSGYSILKGASLAEVKKMVRKHPHLKWARGCEIEVHETIRMK